MRNIKIVIAYDGTRYGGWQVQKNAKTVQGEIEKTLKKILSERVRVTGSGRTDAGVHAKAQNANFRTKSVVRPEKLQNALNANLPDDISVIKIKNVPENFHSQFDAKSKIYRYTILNSRFDEPIMRRLYHKVPYLLDMPLMKKEAAKLEGRHDFKSFQTKAGIQDTVRTVKKISIKKSGNNFIYIDIEADGFLYNMVRNIVGTLVEIGRGYFNEGSAQRILRAKDRRKAGPTAPAKGLTLIKVKY